MYQYLRAGIFAASVFAVYCVAAVFLWRRFVRRTPGKSAFRTLEFLIYGLAALGLVCILYAFNVEPYWPEVTHVTLSSSKLRAPLRIVHFADLHCDGTLRLEKRLPDLIRAQHPDLITYAGDTVVNRAGVPLAREVLSQISGIAPTYVVMGNWDMQMTREWRQSQSDPSFFRGTGVHNLTGQQALVDVGGQQIWIAGATTDQPALVPGLLQQAPKDQFAVFLFHFPDLVRMVEASNADLYLAGHTHGGQIALPFYGALLTFSRFDKKYESGLHAIGHAWIYINRGIGMEGHPPRARFCARPEITVIDIVPSAP